MGEQDKEWLIRQAQSIQIPGTPAPSVTPLAPKGRELLESYIFTFSFGFWICSLYPRLEAA